MSREHFVDDCPGCRPAIISVDTGEVMPQDHPIMVKLNEVWSTTTREEKEAYHRVMCQNSREVSDLEKVQAIMEAFQRVTAGVDI